MAKVTKALVPIILSLLLLGIGCARKPPTITSITPNNGPSGGGTAIRIVGENFKEGAAVTIAGTPVKNMVISPEGTSVTATTPGGPPGAQKVIATNLKAKEPSLPATFTYNPLTVVDNDPQNGAQLPWYPRVTQASATFSQPIETGSASISISGAVGEVMYDPSTKTATFTASEPLPTGASYEVTVSGAKDMAGNVVSEYKFSFSIEEAVRVVWYTVQEGDTLESIAAKPEVYEADPEGDEWKRILEANQDEFVSEDGKYGNDIILDRKNLKPGMVLYIPR
jgi:nucleoid-associated protein YgaU